MRERILEAASTLVREQGITAVTTRKIAAEAGCAEGSIFRIFGDKGGLLAAVLSFGLPETKQLYETIDWACNASDVRSALARVTEALLDFYQAIFPLIGSALADRDLFERYAGAHRQGGTGPRQAWELTFRFLSSQRQAGRIAEAADIETAAILLTGACQNAVWVNMVTGPDSLPHRGEQLPERIAGLLADLVTDRPDD
jgi:AcrR family transcriptional regulator